MVLKLKFGTRSEGSHYHDAKAPGHFDFLPSDRQNPCSL